MKRRSIILPPGLPGIGAAVMLLAALTACPKRESALPGNVEPTASAPTPAPSPKPGANEATSPEGEWVRARRGDIALYIPTVGNLKPRQVSNIGTQVSGRVEAVLVDVGDVVRKDQELIRIDPSLFEIEAAQRKAEVEAAKVDLADAELALKRMQDLWDSSSGSAVPRQGLDVARARRDSAAAHVQQAEQGLRFTQKRLEETVVHAPYAGVISKRLVDPGEAVTSIPVTHLLEIQDVETLELHFSLPQDSMFRVRAGTPVIFQVAGLPNGRGAGEVDVVFPSNDEATRAFVSRVYVDNHDFRFRPGVLAQVGVLSERAENAIIIPRGAVSKTANGWSVMVRRETGSSLTPVEIGVMNDTEAEVRSGLNEGDEVLVPRTA